MADLFSYFQHDPPSKSLFGALYSPEELAALNSIKLESSDNLGE